MKTIARMVSEIATPGNTKCHHSPVSRVELFVAQKRGVPPAHLVRVAEAEELEGRIGEHGVDEEEREAGRDAAEDVRHELTEDDARSRLPGDLGREDEVAVSERERLTAQDPRLDRPAREPDDERHRRRPR